MGDFSDDAGFRLAVGELLRALLDQIDEIDCDELDPRLTSGNLHVTFEDSGAVFIISQQTPTHELWLSANMRAWHFVRRSGIWYERDDARPMLDVLGELFSGRVGAPVQFSL